jgi:hypothetical protein
VCVWREDGVVKNGVKWIWDRCGEGGGWAHKGGGVPKQKKLESLPPSLWGHMGEHVTPCFMLY